MSYDGNKSLNGFGLYSAWSRIKGWIKTTFQTKITGGASTITDNNLTSGRALISGSDGTNAGKVVESSVTATELGYLSGATSNIQTQLSGKASSTDVAGKMNKDITVAGTKQTTADVKFVNGTNTTVAWDSTNSAVKVNATDTKMSNKSYTAGTDKNIVVGTTITSNTTLADVTKTLTEGSNISITSTASAITIASTYSYTLPAATSSALGGVIVGSNISVSSGTISVADASASAKGVLKLYTATGNNTDGTINQSVITTQLGNKAPLASPALTGTPTAPTVSTGTNNTQIATTAFVTSAVAAAQTGAAKFQGVANNDDSSATPDIKNITNYKKGWYWAIGTAGTYAGNVCEAGDFIFCISDYASAYSASDFAAVQTNIQFLTEAEIYEIIDSVE